MSKRIVMCRNARLVPAKTIWPNTADAGSMVMLAELVSEHPALGKPSEGGNNGIRTSLVLSHNFVTGRVETLNTIYQVVV